jgi:uncharacterized protein YoxC
MATTREVLVNGINTLQADIAAKTETVQHMQTHLNQLPAQILDLDHDQWQAVKALVGATQ